MSSIDPSATPKVAIPRLKAKRGDHRSSSKLRPGKACDRCRRRKVRCSGKEPSCGNCLKDNLGPCIYSNPRKDRLAEATERIARLMHLLKDLEANVDDAGRNKIDGVLESLREDDQLSASTMPSSPLKRARVGSSSDDASGFGEALVSGSVGSNEEADLLNEDLLRNPESRATGFVGQSSEVQWLRSLKNQMGATGSGQDIQGTSYGPPGDSHKAVAQRVDARRARRASLNSLPISHVSDSTFYLDRDDMDMDVDVDPYELPPPQMMEMLFNGYAETIHTSFLLLPEEFEEEFHKYIESVKRDSPFKISKRWQAMLNLSFAIGAQYSHLIQAEWQGHEQDHLIYMTRSFRILQMDNIFTLHTKPSLSVIQATSLLSLYHLTIGQVSRAWMMIGISLRFALAVGLHLRNEDPSLAQEKKEGLVRIWWGLHSIESLLCTLIGRPCIIPNADCTVPLPEVVTAKQSSGGEPSSVRRPKRFKGQGLPLSFSRTSSQPSGRGPADQVAHDSFLGARVTIALIVQKALSKLYSPRASVESWEHIQQDIGSLTSEIDQWAVQAELAGLAPARSADDLGVERERLLLSFQYHSARLLICRPCLCRIDRRIRNQSEGSINFNQKTAEACIEAAQSLTGLLPDQPDLKYIYQQCPWWCIVHNIMQAVAVFLLELSFRAAHMSHYLPQISDSVRKLVRLLQAMSVSNAVAERAYKVVINIIKSGAPRVQVDISDTLAEDSRRAQSRMSSNTTIPARPKATPPPRDDDEESYFPEISAKATSLDTARPTSSGPEEPEGGVDEFQIEEFIAWDVDQNMPSLFGNPFSTEYDDPDLLGGDDFAAWMMQSSPGPVDSQGPFCC